MPGVVILLVCGGLLAMATAAPSQCVTAGEWAPWVSMRGGNDEGNFLPWWLFIESNAFYIHRIESTKVT